MRICDLYPIIGREDSPLSPRWPYLMGVELELENVSLNGVEHAYDSYGDQVNAYGWTRHSDASLRNGIEFVTSSPMCGNMLRDAIEAWYAIGYDYECSPRTSTHIHLNLSTSDVEVLRSMIVLVYTIEDSIYGVVEESRKWAGYSMALSEMRPERLRNVLNSPTENVLRDAVVPRRNQERYYGFNFNVGRHGTVEFRYFPGGPSQRQLESWLDLVTLIRKTSEQYTVQELESRINSEEDLRQFLLANLGEWGERLLSVYSVSYLYSKFLDVMALAMDDSNPERQVNIVHMTPSLLTFIERNYCGGDENAIQYIRQSAASFPAMSQQDLTYFVQRCAELSGTPIASPDPWYQLDSSPHYEEDDDHDDYDDVLAEEERQAENERLRREHDRLIQTMQERLATQTLAAGTAAAQATPEAASPDFARVVRVNPAPTRELRAFYTESTDFWTDDYFNMATNQPTRRIP